MRHFRSGRVVLILAVAVAAVAVGIHVSRSQSASSGNLKVVPPGPHSPLDKRAAMVRIDPQPLGEIIERVEKLYATRIEVDWEGIEQVVALRPESYVLVEMRLRDVTLRQSLARVLESIHDGDALVVEAANSAVRMRTLPVGGPGPSPMPDPVARLYDVRDLLAVMEYEQEHGVSFEDRRNICFPSSSPPAKAAKEELESMMMESVRPETWTDNGGTGVLTLAGGRMVVIDSPDVQKEVEQFLTGLRDSLRALHSKRGAVAAPQP